LYRLCGNIGYLTTEGGYLDVSNAAQSGLLYKIYKQILPSSFVPLIKYWQTIPLIIHTSSTHGIYLQKVGESLAVSSLANGTYIYGINCIVALN
jgi:hypothetical protein